MFYASARADWQAADLPGRTGRQRHNVLNGSVHSSVIKLVNTIFCK